jgi:putative transposase
MLRFRRIRSLHKFAAVHVSGFNLCNTERNLSFRANFKLNRATALTEWCRLGPA